MDVELFILHGTKSNITFTGDFDKVRNRFSFFLRPLDAHKHNYKNKRNLLKDHRG